MQQHSGFWFVLICSSKTLSVKEIFPGKGVVGETSNVSLIEQAGAPSPPKPTHSEAPLIHAAQFSNPHQTAQAPHRGQDPGPHHAD